MGPFENLKSLKNAFDDINPLNLKILKLSNYEKFKFIIFILFFYFYSKNFHLNFDVKSKNCNITRLFFWKNSL